MKYFIAILAVLLTCFVFENQVFAAWVPSSPQDLLQESGTVFVGTITAVTQADVEYQSQIAKNGTMKQSVGPEVMTLDEYSVAVEEFLQNPQDSDTMTVRQAAVGGVPSGPALTNGFEVGDRVLFYLPRDEHQVYFSGQYLPESFKIPKYCDAKSVLTQPRIEGRNSFGISQDGVLKEDNFTAGKPMKFVFSLDTGTLFGSGVDMEAAISKKGENQVAFQKNIHSESKPCQWMTSAEWEFTPQEGSYRMYLRYNDGGDTESHGSFSAVSDAHQTASPEKSDSAIGFFDNRPFFVSEKYDAELGTNQTIAFHGVKFTRPSYQIPPNPGGFAFSVVSFDDNATKQLYVGPTENPMPVIAKHNDVYAGLIRSHDGIHLLVSADLHEVSPSSQFKSGIQAEKIQCRAGLELILKSSDGSPTCVKPETKIELVKRGWGSETLTLGSMQGGLPLPAACAQNGGNWLGEYDECEHVSEEQCSLIGGQYEEKSSCRHSTNPDGWCAGEGIPVCTFDSEGAGKSNSSTECETEFNPKALQHDSFPNGTSFTVNYASVFLMQPNSTGKICTTNWKSAPGDSRSEKVFAEIGKGDSVASDVSIVPDPDHITIDDANKTITYTITALNGSHGFYRITPMFFNCNGLPLAVGYDKSHSFDDDFPWMWTVYPCPFQQVSVQITGLSGIDVVYIAKTQG